MPKARSGFEPRRWRLAHLEDDYELIERAETLDRKLAFMSNAASALIDLKDADRSLRLEVIIILLILAEVALAVVPLLRFLG
jgi:uncharacterized Rmd1/YagE family protein